MYIPDQVHYPDDLAMSVCLQELTFGFKHADKRPPCFVVPSSFSTLAYSLVIRVTRRLIWYIRLVCNR